MEDFDAIYARWRTPVWQFLRRQVGDATRADDLLQAVFIKVFRSLDGFRGESSVKTWLFTIAHRCVIDERRGAKAEHVELPDLPAPEPLDCGDAVEAVKRALDALPPPHKALFLLVRFHGLSIAEAGGVVGLTPGSAKVTLLRVQRRLGEILGRVNA